MTTASRPAAVVTGADTSASGPYAATAASSVVQLGPCGAGELGVIDGAGVVGAGAPAGCPGELEQAAAATSSGTIAAAPWRSRPRRLRPVAWSDIGTTPCFSLVLQAVRG